MKKVLTSALLFGYACGVMSWSPQGDKIKTKWTETVTPECMAKLSTSTIET